MAARLIAARWSDAQRDPSFTKEQQYMIEMKGISKTYRVRRREAGLGNALRSLFSRDCPFILGNSV